MQQILVKNRQAAVFWGVFLFCLALMAGVTWAVVIGRSSSAAEWGGLLVGWIVVAIFCGTGLTMPCETATITQDGCVTFTWQYPLSRVRKSFHAAQISTPVVVRNLSSDGDAYYTAQVTLPDGTVFTLTEGIIVSGTGSTNHKSKARSEAACKQFSESIAPVVG